MTQPSEVLDAVARTLRSALQPATAGGDAQPVDVRITDHMLDDVRDVVTFRAPAVILSATGMGETDLSLGTLTADLQITARCYARLPAGPTKVDDTPSDVAMNLAALVATLVDGALWRTPGGQPLNVQRPARIRIQNRSVEGVIQSGYAMWSVAWSQRIELTRADTTAALHAFKTLHVELELGPDAPDKALTVNLPGGNPP